MKANAAVMHKVNEPLVIEQVDLDQPARNEVLIRTAFAGVCPVSYTHLTLPTNREV